MGAMLPSLPSLESVVRQRLPITQWLPGYTAGDAVCDVIAGITVGLTLMPQAIAYAGLAGLGPQYGLYSAWVGCLVYIVFGSTRQVSLGPTSMVSLLTFTYTHDLNTDMAVFLCLMSGCVQLLCGLLQLGFLVDFISVPVISAFTSAAAFTIGSSQLKGLFGLNYNAEAFLDMWLAFLSHIRETHLLDLLLGVACIISLLALKNLKDLKVGSLEGKKQYKFVKRLLWFVSTGRNALVVLSCSIAAYVFYQHGHLPFTLTGKIVPGFPKLTVPPLSTEINGRQLNFLDMVSELGSGILVVPLISITSNIALAKAFTKGGQVDASQEMIALGLCNILGSFAHSMPVAGAFSRSAVNDASGVRSTLGGLYTSAIILLAITLLTPYFYFIPRCSLAAIIMTALVVMVDYQILKPMWASNRRDLVPFLVTFLACLLFGIEKGLLIGVLADVLILLYTTARPPVSIHSVESEPPYWLVQPQGCLVFPGVDYLRETVITRVTEGQARPMVLDCSHMPYSDYTAAQGLGAMIDDMKVQDIQVLLLNADDRLVRSLTVGGRDVRVATSHEQISQMLAEEPVRIETDISLQNLKKDVH